jgi:hypothetical protein
MKCLLNWLKGLFPTYLIVNNQYKKSTIHNNIMTEGLDFVKMKYAPEKTGAYEVLDVAMVVHNLHEY